MVLLLNYNVSVAAIYRYVGASSIVVPIIGEWSLPTRRRPEEVYGFREKDVFTFIFS